MKTLFLIIEAYIRLVAHDAFMSRHDFRSLHQQVKRFPLRRPRRKTNVAQAVSRALDIACAFYPKQALCLQRSSVLVKMLRRRGEPARMVIGAQKLPFKAHAWVEVDSAILNDRLAEREKFLILEVC
jgi:hypothetical protein